MARSESGALLARLLVACAASMLPVAGSASQPSAGEPPSPTELDRLARESVDRWSASAHGPMLTRILPERIVPSELPDAGSRGARLTALYCVQCHYLPNPAMHDAVRWGKVVQRMLPRMQGKGNMGRLMADMMRGPSDPAVAARPLAAPEPAELREIEAYLQRFAQRPLSTAGNAAAVEALQTADGRVFEVACSQCHALPDPSRHRPAQWPDVVRRMEANMAWMNRVVGSKPDPREPQLRADSITGFLQRYSGMGSGTGSGTTSRAIRE